MIVNYNKNKYINAAIFSVLSQTYREFELLIWDDGSTDRSVEIAREYAKGDRRVKVVAASHQGIAKARKEAIAQTSGRYIGWVDSDDMLAPTALEETLAILEDSPRTGLVYTDYLDIDKTSQVKGYGNRCQIPYSPQRLLVDFMTFHFRLIRREIFERVGGINPTNEYAYDYDLCLRLSEVTRVHHLKKPLYYYRHHDKTISCRQRPEQIRDSQKAISLALQRRGLAKDWEIKVEGGIFSLQRRSVVKKPVAELPLAGSW